MTEQLTLRQLEQCLEAWLEGAVVALAAVPVARVLLKRPIRRELGAHPVIAVALIGAAGIVLALCTWFALSSDLGRRIVVALAAAGALVAFVHARPGFGRSRGLPPGSLGLATSLDAIDDPAFYARTASRWGPVFKMRQMHQPVVCVTDLPTSVALMRSENEALVQSNWSFNRLVPGGYLEFMNGEHHARYRSVLAAGFRAGAVGDWQPVITTVVRRQLAVMSRSSTATGLDPEPHLLPIPLTSLLATVLGVEPGSTRFDSLAPRFVELNRPMELFLPAPRAKQDLYDELTTEVSALAREARDEQSASGRESALSAIVRENPGAADDPTVIGNLILMVKEGGIMVRGLLRWVLKMLADDELRAQRFRDEQSNPQQLKAFAAAFVQETIRLYESRYLYRRAARDLTIDRYNIPQGWLVRLCLGEGHENATHFPEPTRFDADRFVRRAPDPATFCPFGSGRHACLGDELTMAIATTFAIEAALGYDLRTLQDGKAWRINRHWGLWRPSQELRIAMIPLAP